VAEQCSTFHGRPETVEADERGRSAVALAGRLWDLDAWADEARALRAELVEHVGPLEDGDTSVLAPAFELSAAVLRLLLHDPLLPTPLLPRDWPGAELRTEYDRYDAAFKALWRDWFRAHR
jgi:phenylacetic acid degradation operon negative regulatory protein